MAEGDVEVAQAGDGHAGGAAQRELAGGSRVGELQILGGDGQIADAEIRIDGHIQAYQRPASDHQTVGGSATELHSEGVHAPHRGAGGAGQGKRVTGLRVLGRELRGLKRHAAHDDLTRQSSTDSRQAYSRRGNVHMIFTVHGDRQTNGQRQRSLQLDHRLPGSVVGVECDRTSGEGGPGHRQARS